MQRSESADRRRARSASRENSQQRWERRVSSPATRRGRPNSNDRRLVQLVRSNESVSNDERSESTDRTRAGSKSTSRDRGDSQQRWEKRVSRLSTRRGRPNSKDRRFIKMVNESDDKRSESSDRRRDVSISREPSAQRGEKRENSYCSATRRCLEEEWKGALRGSGHTDEKREALRLGGPVARPMSRKKMRKLMRHRRVSLPNEEELAEDDRQSISPTCDHDTQSVDLDQSALMDDDTNNNSDGREATGPNPKKKASRLPLLKRLWQSMCCSSDQGQRSTVDPFIGCRKLFRLKSKAKKSKDNTSLKQDEVPSWKLLRKYQSARNEMVAELSSLDYNDLVNEYQNLLKTDSMNEEITHKMENVHEIVKTDEEYEAYCKKFQADQEALMRQYAKARAERERRRLRAEISNAVISREAYQRQIDEISATITELTIILNGVQDVKCKTRGGANKNGNAKRSEKRFDGSEPLPVGIKETEEVPFPNLSVLLKDIERKAMTERGEKFEKRAEIAERLRLAEENGGVLHPREVDQKMEFVKRGKKPEDNVQAEKTRACNENVDGQTPVLVIESVTGQTESGGQAGGGLKRAVAFVIDMEGDNRENKVKKLPPKRFSQRLRVEEENSVQKAQRAVAFVVDIGDGDNELDARRAKKMASLTSKKMSNQECPDSNSFQVNVGNERQVRFAPGTKQGTKTLANHGARRPPPTNRTVDNMGSSLNRNQQHANQKSQPSKWRTNRTHELASKQTAKRAKLFNNRNAIRTPSKYSAIKSSISTFRNKNDTDKSKCYTAWKANNMETKPEIVKQKKQPIANYAMVKSAISTFRNKNNGTNKSKCYTKWKSSNMEARKTKIKSEIVQKKQPITKYASVKSVISTFRNIKKDTATAKESKHKPGTEKQLLIQAKYAQVQEFTRMSRLCKETTVFKYRSHPMHATMNTRIPKPCATVIGAASRFADRFIPSVTVPGRVALRKDYWREKFVDKPWEYNVVWDMPNSYQRPRAKKASKIPLTSSILANKNKYRLKPADMAKHNAPVTCKRENNGMKKAAPPRQAKSPFTTKRPDSVRDQMGDNFHHEGEITPRCFSPYCPLPPITPRVEVKSDLKVHIHTKEKRVPKINGLKYARKYCEDVMPRVNANSSLDNLSPLPPIKTNRSATSRSATSRPATSRSATSRPTTSRPTTSRKSTPHVTHRDNAHSPLGAIKPLPPIKDGRKTGGNYVIVDKSTSFCKKITSVIKTKAAKKQALRASVVSSPHSCRDAGYPAITPTPTKSIASSSNMRASPKHPPKELPPLRHSPNNPKPNANAPTMGKSPDVNRKPNQLSPLRHSPVYKDKPAVKQVLKEASMSKRKPNQLAPLPHTPVVDQDGSPIPVGHYSYNFDVPNDMVGFNSKFQIPRTPEPNYGR